MHMHWRSFPSRSVGRRGMFLLGSLGLALFGLFGLVVDPREALSAGSTLASSQETASTSGLSMAKVYQAWYAATERAKHLTLLGVDRWHATGYRGHGLKVAILDSGFRGYREHLGLTLPAQVTVRSFRRDGNLEEKDSQHGILCGEVVHALAPDAEILFANWE
jgi:hypothetical protein